MAQEQSTTSGEAIIQINEDHIKDHLGEIVRGTGNAERGNRRDIKLLRLPPRALEEDQDERPA